MKFILELIIMLTMSLYDGLSSIITNTNKGFLATFTGFSAFTLPSYACNLIGHQTPELLMKLQTVGLVVTITLGCLSTIKLLWDMTDRVMLKIKNKKKNKDANNNTASSS